MTPPPLRVLVAHLRAAAPRWAFPPWAEQQLRDATPPGWELRILASPAMSDGDGGSSPDDELLGAVQDAEAYAGFGISRELFLAAPRLGWVHSAAAGVGSALFPEMRNSEVVLTNSAGVHAEPIADHVLGGVLYFLRSLDIALAQQRETIWDREPFVGAQSTMREVADCRALVVGAGGIGSAIARRLTALGCTCTAVRRRSGLGVPDGFAAVTGPEEWRALLPQTDLLILTAPATSETRHLVTRSELDSLSSGAILVNVARGSLVEEGSLVAALQAGRLRGAVLDVFEEEPLAPHNPLWGMSNVLITPHVSGVTAGAFWRRQIDLLVDNWHRWDDGRALRNVVDKHAGY